MSICKLLAEAADLAKREDRPAPVIETDTGTAHLIAKALAREIGDVLGCYLPLDHPERVGFGVICIYDDVKIKVRKP